MADIQEFFANMRIEKFENFKLDSNLSNFDVSENTVVFFDLEDNPQISQYIENQFSELNKKFAEVNRNLIYISNLDYPKDIRDLLKFYLPYLSASDLKKFYSEEHILSKMVNEMFELFEGKSSGSVFKSEYQSILDYIGYKGNIKSGFIFFDHPDYRNYNTHYNTSILECNDLLLKDSPDAFFEKLIQFFKNENDRIEEYDCMIDNSPEYYAYQNLDDDTKEKVLEIQSQLRELRDSGQLLFALPILKDILNSEANKINLNSVSKVLIMSNYRIVLPYFDNLEIQLSHLTKAIYILFYNNPQGINIKELYKYRKELLDLYSNISYQIDYDKIQQSIDDLVNPESKAIYTHISRIKTAFYKQMYYVYAKNYIVAGKNFGDDFKYIPIIRTNVIYDPEFND
ncbi:hypothetical protein [Flavobacterium sp. 83]|uniref:hypothetical protein n=1 Tax=Flavobacterium sp. 83 TaxID=1131812 RepID=UPI000557749C|nr:hypothetical protein [Flavobacterium sp. 83]